MSVDTRIMESFICSKSPDRTKCEDGLFVGKDVVAVIDGCTSKSAFLWQGRTGGAFARDLICRALERGVPTDSPLRFYEALSEAIRRETEKQPECLHKDLPRACVIAYIPGKEEIWSYGDCRCRIGDEVFCHEKQIDVLLSEKRAAAIAEGLKNGRSLDELAVCDFGRKAIEADLVGQLEYENRHIVKDGVDLGYPVLNGEAVCEDMIVVHRVGDGGEIVLASDGYPELKGTLAESEAALAEIIEKDPHCYVMCKSTKGLAKGNLSFDDRTYIRIATGK